jgi:pyridoxal phosphate enzyme (YggS family)
LTYIADNVAAVRGRIAEAAARAGCAVDDVRLVAVTKYVGTEEIRALVAAGCADLGESRPQQLWDRSAELRDLPVRWHMIGHVQRNKVERTVPLVAMIHSLDSLRLAEAIDAAAGKLDTNPKRERGQLLKVPVLLEVNISRDPAKHGFAPAEIEPLLPKLGELAHLEIRGLMCMAGLEGGGDEARRDFANMRTLRDRLRASSPVNVRLDELSMGMSGDYEIAIEEGATIVRIGSALFERPEAPE